MWNFAQVEDEKIDTYSNNFLYFHQLMLEFCDTKGQQFVHMIMTVKFVLRNWNKRMFIDHKMSDENLMDELISVYF